MNMVHVPQGQRLEHQVTGAAARHAAAAILGQRPQVLALGPACRSGHARLAALHAAILTAPDAGPPAAEADIPGARANASQPPLSQNPATQPRRPSGRAPTPVR